MLTYYIIKQKYNHFAASHVIIRVVFVSFQPCFVGIRANSLDER